MYTDESRQRAAHRGVGPALGRARGSTWRKWAGTPSLASAVTVMGVGSRASGLGTLPSQDPELQ